MNIQEENSAPYFRVQSEREQTFSSMLKSIGDIWFGCSPERLVAFRGFVNRGFTVLFYVATIGRCLHSFYMFSHPQSSIISRNNA